MELDDKLTYQPATDDGFPAYDCAGEDQIDEAVIRFRQLVSGRLEEYIEASKNDDLPIWQIGFAIDLIFEIGKRDGTKQAYREIQSTLDSYGRKVQGLLAENTKLNSQINELILPKE